MAIANVLRTAAASITANGDGWGNMGPWGWSMAFFGLLFMAALTFLVIWSAGPAVPPPGGPGESSSKPIDNIDARHAPGEVEQDEYLERKADLKR